MNLRELQPEMAKSLSLDEWLRAFEQIYYFTQNHERSAQVVLCRVFETVLNLQKAAIKRRDYDDCRVQWLPKVFAWFCALIRSLEIRNLENLVWSKFPGMCPFCENDECGCASTVKQPVKKDTLAIRAREREGTRPQTLGEWQDLFERIYHQVERGTAKIPKSIPSTNGDRLLTHSFLKLYEELTELAEAIRLRPFFPDNLANEAADVFACICGLANVLPNSLDRSARIDLGLEVWRRYPGRCDTCHNSVCNCRGRAERERLSKEGVREFERRDALTGLYNREQYEIDRRRLFLLPEDEVLAELFFDCDDLKPINDSTPDHHSQGDAVLKSVASTAAESLHRTELYRIGGDEFCALVRGTSVEDVRSTALSLFSAVSSATVPSVAKQGVEYPVRISLGVAIRTGNMKSADDLHASADAALYKAKTGGKNRMEFADNVEMTALPM